MQMGREHNGAFLDSLAKRVASLEKREVEQRTEREASHSLMKELRIQMDVIARQLSDIGDSEVLQASPQSKGDMSATASFLLNNDCVRLGPELQEWQKKWDRLTDRLEMSENKIVEMSAQFDTVCAQCPANWRPGNGGSHTSIVGSCNTSRLEVSRSEDALHTGRVSPLHTGRASPLHTGRGAVGSPWAGPPAAALTAAAAAGAGVVAAPELPLKISARHYKSVSLSVLNNTPLMEHRSSLRSKSPVGSVLEPRSKSSYCFVPEHRSTSPHKHTGFSKPALPTVTLMPESRAVPSVRVATLESASAEASSVVLRAASPVASRAASPVACIVPGWTSRMSPRSTPRLRRISGEASQHQHAVQALRPTWQYALRLQ